MCLPFHRGRHAATTTFAALKRTRDDDARLPYGEATTSCHPPSAKRPAADHARADLLDGAGQHAALASWAARVPNADAVSTLRNGVSSHAFAGKLATRDVDEFAALVAPVTDHTHQACVTACSSGRANVVLSSRVGPSTSHGGGDPSAARSSARSWPKGAMRGVVLSDCASIDHDALRQETMRMRAVEADVQRQALLGAHAASTADVAAVSGGRSYARGVWGWLSRAVGRNGESSANGQAHATGAAAGPPSSHSSQTAVEAAIAALPSSAARAVRHLVNTRSNTPNHAILLACGALQGLHALRGPLGECVLEGTCLHSNSKSPVAGSAMHRHDPAAVPDRVGCAPANRRAARRDRRRRVGGWHLLGHQGQRAGRPERDLTGGPRVVLGAWPRARAVSLGGRV